MVSRDRWPHLGHVSSDSVSSIVLMVKVLFCDGNGGYGSTETIILTLFYRGAQMRGHCGRWVSHDCAKEVRDGFTIDDATTVIAGASICVGTAALRAPGAFAAADEEVSHSAEAIHQEVMLKAQRARVRSAHRRQAVSAACAAQRGREIRHGEYQGGKFSLRSSA
jgi:hypothetical protein